MSSLNVHFGLGLATQIDKVIVRWPSGIIDIINNPAVNQRLPIVESSTLDVASFSDKDFSLYPNPAKDFLNITIKNGLSVKLAQVYDLTGRLGVESNLKTPSINIQSLAVEPYILLFRDENDKDYSKKFIKE